MKCAVLATAQHHIYTEFRYIVVFGSRDKQIIFDTYVIGTGTFVSSHVDYDDDVSMSLNKKIDSYRTYIFHLLSLQSD